MGASVSFHPTGSKQELSCLLLQLLIRASASLLSFPRISHLYYINFRLLDAESLSVDILPWRYVPNLCPFLFPLCCTRLKYIGIKIFNSFSGRLI